MDVAETLRAIAQRQDSLIAQVRDARYSCIAPATLAKINAHAKLTNCEMYVAAHPGFREWMAEYGRYGHKLWLRLPCA